MKTLSKLLLLILCASCATDHEYGNEMNANEITHNELYYSVEVMDETTPYTLGVFVFGPGEPIVFDDPAKEIQLTGDTSDMIVWDSKVASFAILIYNCGNLKYTLDWQLYKDGEIFKSEIYKNY
ncbi:MAG TPA: hypothetical protein VFM82_05725 [Flavobacteriaceae bacterium]|nr:hypothetical protein [Flavobacteriaceae bacterium]